MDIVGNLLDPKFPRLFRKASSKCDGVAFHQQAPVPKITVNEDGKPCRQEDDIWGAAKHGGVSIEAEAQGTQRTSQLLFRLSVAASYGAHPTRNVGLEISRSHLNRIDYVS
jgi:hypothetical protein